MSEPIYRVRYEHGVTAPEVRTLIERGWLQRVEPCEHGNIFPHIDGLRSHADVLAGGQYVWCEGAALEVNDE